MGGHTPVVPTLAVATARGVGVAVAGSRGLGDSVGAGSGSHMSHCQEWLGSGSSGERREWRGGEGRGGGREGEGRGGDVTVHALHQVTQPHRVCARSLMQVRGCRTPFHGRGCWPHCGPRLHPLHVRECGRGQGSCSRSWGCDYLWGRSRRRVRRSLAQMICTVGTSLTHPPPSPYHRVEESESRTWVFVLPRALESCCRRTEWCCPPLVSGNQRQLGSFPIGRGFSSPLVLTKWNERAYVHIWDNTDPWTCFL